MFGRGEVSHHRDISNAWYWGAEDLLDSNDHRSKCSLSPDERIATAKSRATPDILRRTDWRSVEGYMYWMTTIINMFVAILSTTVIPSALAQQDTPSLWRHNGSTVYLVVSGPKREFYYQEPREGLVQAGARQNSLLFSGAVKGKQYFGTALIYNPRCGTFTYPASGPILDNYRRVVLRGQAPRVGPDCKVAGHFTDTLEFVLQSSPSTEGSTSGVLKPFTGVWTDLSGVCKSNLDE
jgi:hypothetical protein